MPGLRERRHTETKQVIRDAAFALFAEVGFVATTMEQIAERSGVSRSTLYRRFANKDDIVLAVANEWLAAWDDAQADVGPNVALADAISTGCRAVASTIDSTPELVRASYRALAASPSLQVSGAATTGWFDRFVDLVTQRAPALDPADALTIAGAYLGAIDTMMRTWAAGDENGTVLASTERILERLEPILL